MGCFSFKCKKSGEPINSSSFSGDAVHLFLLKNGKVIEHMYGNYDSYGRVFKNTKDVDDTSFTEYSSFKWKLPWGDVCDLMFSGGSNDNGIAAILDEYYDGNHPKTKSEDDPNQGWGDEKYCSEIKEPFHKIY